MTGFPEAMLHRYRYSSDRPGILVWEREYSLQAEIISTSIILSSLLVPSCLCSCLRQHVRAIAVRYIHTTNTFNIVKGNLQE